MIVQEVIHQSKKIKPNGYLLKLNFQKANDIIDNDCLLEILRPQDFQRGLTN